jgi:pimeloyl-ACP methyl ester carboxylesterase
MGLGFTRVAPGQGVTPSDQADMLAAFLDTLGIASVDLVANDSGGAVAQIFVTRFPDRVRTLLLTNCDVEPDSPPPALQPVLALAREGTYPDQWLVPWFQDPKLARSPEGFGGMCFSDPSQPTDAAIADVFRAPSGRHPGQQGPGQRLHPGPGPQSPGRDRGGPAPVQGSRAHRLGHGRRHLRQASPDYLAPSCPTRRACAACPRPSCSGRRNIPTWWPRRRGVCGECLKMGWFWV